MSQNVTGWDDEKGTRKLLITSLILVGIIEFLPHLASLVRGEGLFPFLYLDESYYAGAITKFCEEKGWGFGEVYSYEDREKPFLYPRLPFIVLSIFSSLIGVGPTFVILHCVGPMLIFYLFFLLLKNLGFKRTLCLGGALIYVLQFHLLDTLNNYIISFGISGLADFILPIRREYAMVFNVARVPDPALTRPVMLIAVILMMKILGGNRSKWVLLSTVISFSACVFLRVFDWTILYPTAVLFVIHAFVSENKDRAQRLGIAILITLPFVAYFVIGAQQAFHAFPETFYRNNAEDGRWIWPETFKDAILLCLIVVAAVVSWRTPARWLVNYCFISFILAMNVQLITGYNIGGYHWKVFHVYPLIVTIFGMCGLSVLLSHKRESLSLLVVLIIALQSAICHFRLRTRLGANQRYNEALELAKHVEPGAVLCSDFALASKPSGAFYCFFPYPAFSAASSRDVMERFVIQQKLFGADEISDADLHGIFYLHFTRYSRLDDAGKKQLLMKMGLTDENIRSMKELFRSLPSNKGELIELVRKKYRMDYLMIESKDIENYSAVKRLEKVAEGKTLVLLRVK